MFNEDSEYKKTTTTLVLLVGEAKNNLGFSVSDNYYVFFIPNEKYKNGYDIEYSKSILVNDELEKKIRFE